MSQSLGGFDGFACFNVLIAERISTIRLLSKVAIAHIICIGSVLMSKPYSELAFESICYNGESYGDNKA